MKPWLGPMAVAAVCAVGVAALELRPRTEAGDRAQASAPAIALLDGLQPGDKVAGWTVLGIDGPREETVRIDFGRDDVRFAVTISPLGAEPHTPAMKTDVYALYYGHAHPDEASVPAGATRALLANISRRLRKTEHDVALVD